MMGFLAGSGAGLTAGAGAGARTGAGAGASGICRAGKAVSWVEVIVRAASCVCGSKS